MLDRAEFAVVRLVLADQAGLVPGGTLDRVDDAALDEREVGRVRCRGAGKVAALLHEHLFGLEALGELLGEPGADVHGIELDVAERIALDGVAARLHLGDHGFDAGAFADKEVYVALPVEQLVQALHLRVEIERHLGQINPVHRPAFGHEPETGHELAAVDETQIVPRRGGGQPAAVPPHDLVDDDHARAGAVFADDILKILRALFGRGERAEALVHWRDVVVDRLG